MSDTGGLLEVRDLCRHFRGFRALDGVTFALEPGEILGLVGPNGSGKTTLVNVVSGVLRASGGDVILRGRSIKDLPSHQLVRRGINRTFQIPKPFGELTVRENVEVSLWDRENGRVPWEQILERTELRPFAAVKASSLTAAQQKRLDLARALATKPTVLLIDELGAGLSPAELKGIAALLRSICQEGVGMIVIEHLLGFLEQVTDRVIVLNAGQVLFEGGLSQATRHPEVVKVFLGG